MNLVSRLLRWIDRRRVVADFQKIARAHGLTPIEIAAVSRIVRGHHETHGCAIRAIFAGLDAIKFIKLHRKDSRPLEGVVIHLPRGRIGGAR